MKKHYRKELDCLNCGAHLEGHFCHVCGQENLQLKENFWHLMVESIGDYFHFDSKFFHTLKPLLFIPGKLTNDYNAGKRVQYLHPIRMYIFISLVFFIVLFKYTKSEEKATREAVKNGATKNNPVMNLGSEAEIDSVKKAMDLILLIPEKQKQRIYAEMEKRKQQLQKDSTKNDDKKSKPDKPLPDKNNVETVEQYEKDQKALPKEKRDGIFKSYVVKKIIQWKAHGENSTEIIIENFKHNLPKLMFFLLPVYALILKLVFRRSKKFYVEHLIHSIHTHCFYFLFYLIYMLFGFVLPGSWMDVMQGIAFIIVSLYIYKSFRAVYHRGRWRTLTKMTGVGISYSFAVLVFIGILAVVSFISM